MSILDKIPFIGGKDKVAQGNMVVYSGSGDDFDKNYLGQISGRLNREVVEEGASIDTRIWDGTQGLEVSSDKNSTYRIKLFEDGKVSLEIRENHPDREQVLEVLETFYGTEFTRKSG